MKQQRQLAATIGQQKTLVKRTFGNTMKPPNSGYPK